MLKSKTSVIHIILIAIVFTIAFINMFSPYLDINGDNANYIMLARNIAHGHGYSDVQPGGTYAPATFYPVGYPAFLSLFIALGIDNLIFFKILNGILLFGLIAFEYFLISSISKNNHIAFCICIMTALSTELLRFASMAMSETLFAFFSILAIYSLFKHSSSDKKYGGWFWTACAAAIAGYYIRSIGVSLVLAVIGFFLFQKEWKKSIISTAAMGVMYLPWFIRNKIVDSSFRYFTPIFSKNIWRPEEGQISTLGEFMDKTWINIQDTVLKAYDYLLLPSWFDYEKPITVWGIIIGILFFALIIYGLWQLKPIRWAMLIYFLGSAGVIILWHSGNDTRYVTPMIPILVIGFWYGLISLIKSIFKIKSRGWIVLISYCTLVGCFALVPSIKKMKAYQKHEYSQTYRDYFDAAKFVANLDIGDSMPLLYARKPELIGYYAQNVCCRQFPYTSDKEAFLNNLVNNNVTYVISDQLNYSATKKYLRPVLIEYSDFFTPIYKADKTATMILVFNIRKAKAYLISKHYFESTEK